MPKIEDIEISKLIPNPLNVKKHPKEQIHDLALQIQQEPGFTNPLVIDEDYMIWVGHGRLEAVKSLGWEKIPCIMVHDMSEGEKYRYMIKDNQVNESPWIKENLQIAYDKIDPILFEPFQMDIQDIGVKLPITEETEDIPEPPVTPKSKLGDVYQLGRHTLICGDNLDVEIPPKIDLILTDPPYNIGFNYNGIDDKKSNNDYADFIKNWINRYHESKIIVTPGPQNLKIWHDVIIPNDVGVWLKRNSRSGASAFHFRRCEPILFYGKFDKRTDDVFDYTMENYSELSDIQYQKGVGESHAPAKPLKFWRELINCYTNEGDVILDTFMGTGTTLITCEQTNRICYGMELDPAYIDVIITRWENYTGKKAKKV